MQPLTKSYYNYYYYFDYHYHLLLLFYYYHHDYHWLPHFLSSFLPLCPLIPPLTCSLNLLRINHTPLSPLRCLAYYCKKQDQEQKMRLQEGM